MLTCFWGVVLPCEHNALGVRIACVIQITLDIRAHEFPDAVTERLQSEQIRINAGTIRPHIDVHGLGGLTRQVPIRHECPDKVTPHLMSGNG